MLTATVVGQQEGTGSHLPGSAEFFRGIGRSWLSDYVNYPLWMENSWPIGIVLRGLSAHGGGWRPPPPAARLRPSAADASMVAGRLTYVRLVSAVLPRASGHLSDRIPGSVAAASRTAAARGAGTPWPRSASSPNVRRMAAFPDTQLSTKVFTRRHRWRSMKARVSSC
jgi:hypothetical protein